MPPTLLSMRAIAICGLVAGMLIASRAMAADTPVEFPQRPVRMIVPFAPGGGSDIVARVLALGLNQSWRQAVVVDNRPGAGSIVGTAIAAKAVPDGYTLLVSSSAIVFGSLLYRQPGFDATRDLRSVSLLARQPSILAVAGGVDARTVKELIALARAQPGKLAFGSAGSGSATHLGGELFRYMAGVELIHLPYKSAGLAMTALLAGEVQVLTTNTATVLPHVKSGRIRALAVSSPKRSSLSPDLPTIAESGLQGFEYDTWYGLFAPAAMADARTARVHADTLQVLRDAKVAERLSAQGVEVVGSSQAELVQFMAAETSRWSRVVAAAGIQPQ